MRNYSYILSFKIIAVVMCLAQTLSPEPLFAQRTKSSASAGEQVKAEKGLKDNRYFFYFINSSITNFGTDEDKRIFREAILRDMISQMLYMRFHFRDSYQEIRKAQKLLIDVYRSTLMRDIENNRLLLNTIVPSVLDSNNRDALSHVRLGYRDLNVANIYLGMGDNIRETLYSMRLYKYVEAMKTAKHGSRYAILGMITLAESRADTSHRYGPMRPFLSVTAALQNAFDEYDWKNLNFNTIEQKIMKYAPPDELDKYLDIHYDSYFRFRNRESFFDTIWDRAEVYTIDDYQKYKSSID